MLTDSDKATMKSSLIQQRPYQEVGGILRDMIAQKRYVLGERLPPEREIAERLNVSRTLIREALIMLELEGLIEVRRGAGIFVISTPDTQPGGKRERSADGLQ